MRILLALGWYFPESIGGTEVYVRSLATRLRDEGQDVRIAAPLAGLSAPEEYEHAGVRVFRYPVPLEPTRDEAQANVIARGTEHLRNFLEAYRPDIFHVHSLVTGLSIFELEAARQRAARVIYTNHLPSMGYICLRGTLLRDGRTPCDGLQEEEKCGACLLQQRDVPGVAARGVAGLPRSLARTLARFPGAAGTALGIRAIVSQAAQRQRRLMEICERVVVLNDWAARIFISNGAPPEKVVVNRLGTSHAGLTRKPGPAERPTASPVTIGYVGRLHEVKGLHVLAEAIRQIPRSIPLRVIIAGPVADVHAQSVLDDFRRTIAGDDRVTITAAVPPERIGQHLATLDLLCCPSVWFENGPTIALESMAVGTPVMGTRLGAFVEILEDGVNGCVVEPGDPAALAQALTRVAQTPAQTIDVWRRALTPVRTMNEIATDYLMLYRALAAPVVTVS